MILRFSLLLGVWCIRIILSQAVDLAAKSSSLHVPYNINIFIVTNTDYSSSEYSGLLTGLQKTLSRSTATNTGHLPINTHLIYSIELLYKEIDFMSHYEELISQHGTDSLRGGKAVSMETLMSFLESTTLNRFAPKVGLHDLSILIIPRAYRKVLPKHEIVDRNGNRVPIYTTFSNMKYLFYDLSADYINYDSDVVDSFMDILSIISCVTSAVESFSISSNAVVSDYILSGSNYYFPIILLHRLNDSHHEDSNNNSSILNLKMLNTWAGTYASIPAPSSATLTIGNYFIDEHPQISVALSSSLRVKSINENHNQIVFSDSSILCTEIKEIADSFIEEILDRSFIKMDIEFQMHAAKDHSRKHQEYKAKKNEPTKKIKKLSSSMKKRQNPLDQLDILHRDRDVPLVRRVAVVPIFVVQSIEYLTHAMINSKITFETGSDYAVFDDYIVVLQSSLNRERDVTSLVATSISKALTGREVTDRDILDALTKPSNESVLSRVSMRTGLVLRANRLIDMIVQARETLATQTANTLKKLHAMSRDATLNDVDIREMLSLSNNTEAVDHYSDILSHMKSLDIAADILRASAFSLDQSSIESSNLQKSVDKISSSLDEIILKAKELEDVWDELFVNAVVLPCDSISKIHQELNENKEKSMLKPKKDKKQFTVMGYLLVFLALLGFGVGSFLMLNHISSKAKKMQ